MVGELTTGGSGEFLMWQTADAVVRNFRIAATDGKQHETRRLRIRYDPSAASSARFFQTVQNKMHWAIVEQTAAEIIHTGADAEQPRMGLTNWSGDRPGKADVGVAKNYLNRDELFALNLIVAAYLDFAELQAFSRKPMTISDWIAKLDDFVRLSDQQILTHVGTVSHHAPKLKEQSELEKVRAAQDALLQPVDVHVEKVMEELHQVEGRLKKRGGKKKGGQGE